MKFITSDPNFTDYRPAVDVTGTQVVFERTPVAQADALTTFYLATAIFTPTQAVSPFLKVPANPPPPFPFEQTRPDWSWANNEIAFAGGPSATSPLAVHIVPATGTGSRLLAQTEQYIYPIWSSDGTQLIVYNSSSNASPVKPVTSLITPDGTVVAANLDGVNANNVAMFGGFAAPKPSNPTFIAYAGQPALAGWAASAPAYPGTSPEYNQDYNYVFVNAVSSAGAYTSAPLEPAASIATYDPLHQGRAPYWSPDGNYMVFESDRAGGYALFLANVAKVSKGAAPVQLTDPSYAAQHGKFMPGGKAIVLTALQKPSAVGTGPRGIATIDISAFL